MLVGLDRHMAPVGARQQWAKGGGLAGWTMFSLLILLQKNT
jgi:hypothetical protein